MCLSTVYPKKKREELIAKHQKNGFITVRKAFKKPCCGFGYTAANRHYCFFAGKNKTKGKRIGLKYVVSFHSFLTKRDAYDWVKGYDQIVIRCKVPVKSVVAMGYQSWGGAKLEIIVSTEIICPKYFGSKK